MTHLRKEAVLDLKRKRGELNIPIIELARQTGVSRWTLTKILKGTTAEFRKSTVSKIDIWLEDL